MLDNVYKAFHSELGPTISNFITHLQRYTHAWVRTHSIPLWRTVWIVTLLSGPKERLLGADRQGSASYVSFQQQCRHCRKSRAKEPQSEVLTLAFSSQRCPRLEPSCREKETGTSTTKTANRRGHGGAAVFWGQRLHGEPTGGTFQHMGFCRSPPSSSSILVGRPSGDWIPLCSQSHILAFPPWPPTSIFSSFLPTFISLLKPPSRRDASPMGCPKGPVWLLTPTSHV